LDTKHQQEVVLGKTLKWVGRLKNEHLPTHLAWKAYQFQLWLSMRYGIATLATPRKEIEEMLCKLEFEMLSYLTSQVAPAIRFSLGKVDAQCFYTKAVN
jgi:hypothetical protein